MPWSVLGVGNVSYLEVVDGNVFHNPGPYHETSVHFLSPARGPWKRQIHLYFRCARYLILDSISFSLCCWHQIPIHNGWLVGCLLLLQCNCSFSESGCNSPVTCHQSVTVFFTRLTHSLNRNQLFPWRSLIQGQLLVVEGFASDHKVHIQTNVFINL